jgi:hypothetical protein
MKAAIAAFAIITISIVNVHTAPIADITTTLFIPKGTLYANPTNGLIVVATDHATAVQHALDIAENITGMVTGHPFNTVALRPAAEAIIIKAALLSNMARDLQTESIRVQRSLSFATVIGGLFNAVSGIFTAVELHQLRKTQGRVIHDVATNYANIQSLSHEANKLEKAFRVILQSMDAYATTQQSISLTLLANAILDKSITAIQASTSSVHDLVNGRVPAHLLSLPEVSSTWRNFTQVAAVAGLQPITDDPAMIYKLSAILVIHDGIWSAVIKVPLVDKTTALQLWEWIPLPFHLHDGGAATIVTEDRWLAISDGLARDKESASFSQHTFDSHCTLHHPEVYTCHTITIDKNPSRTCLSALFTEATSASDLCLLRKAPASPTYARVGQGRVYIFAPEAIATMLSCKTAAPKYTTLHAKGPIEVKIPDGCTLDTPLWRFESPGSLTSSSSTLTKRINIDALNTFMTSTADQHPMDNVTVETPAHILLDFTKAPRPEVKQPWWPLSGPLLMSLIFSVVAMTSSIGILGFLCYRAHTLPNT